MMATVFLRIFNNLIGWMETIQLPCLFRKYFHVDCPGCGIQRSFLALLRADIPASLQYYPALIPMLLYFGFLILHSRYRFRYGKLISTGGAILIFIIILTAYTFKLTNQN